MITAITTTGLALATVHSHRHNHNQAEYNPRGVMTRVVHNVHSNQLQTATEVVMVEAAQAAASQARFSSHNLAIIQHPVVAVFQDLVVEATAVVVLQVAVDQPA